MYFLVEAGHWLNDMMIVIHEITGCQACSLGGKSCWPICLFVLEGANGTHCSSIWNPSKQIDEQKMAIFPFCSPVCQNKVTILTTPGRWQSLNFVGSGIKSTYD